MRLLTVLLLLASAMSAQSKKVTPRVSPDCVVVASYAKDTQRSLSQLDDDKLESVSSSALSCASERHPNADAQSYAAGVLFFAARELGIRRNAANVDKAAMSVAKSCDEKMKAGDGEYNALVDRYNGLVRSYNSLLADYRSHMESDRQYDALVNAALSRPVQQRVYYPPPQPQQREIQCTTTHMPGSVLTSTTCN